MVPLINGRSYDWAQLVIKFSNSNLPLAEVKSISYDRVAEIISNYGAGRYKTSYGYGNVEVTASISLSLNDWVQIQKACPNGKPEHLPFFDIIVSYTHPEIDRIVVDKIKKVKITNNPRSLEQGSGEFVVDLELFVGDIEYDSNSFEDISLT